MTENGRGGAHAPQLDLWTSYMRISQNLDMLLQEHFERLDDLDVLPEVDDGSMKLEFWRLDAIGDDWYGLEALNSLKDLDPGLNLSVDDLVENLRVRFRTCVDATQTLLNLVRTPIDEPNAGGSTQITNVAKTFRISASNILNSVEDTRLAVL